VQLAEQVVHAAVAQAPVRVPLIRIESTMAREVAAQLERRNTQALVDEPGHAVADGLAWRLAMSTGDAVFTVSEPWLRERRVARVELEMAAWKNLRVDRERAWTDVGDGLFMAPWEDGNAASRLVLGRDCAAGLPIARPVFVPATVEVVFAFDDADDDAVSHVVKHVAEQFTAPSLRPLTTRPYALGDDGKLAPWKPAAHRVTRAGVSLKKIVEDLAHFERACFGAAARASVRRSTSSPRIEKGVDMSDDVAGLLLVGQELGPFDETKPRATR
jgi:hypothetical protein